FQDPGAEHVPYYDREKGESKARAALDALRPWGPGLEELPLENERPAVRKELYDLLLLLAQTRARHAAGADEARGVVPLLDPAAGLREPTRWTYRLRADAYRLQGDADRAAAAEHRAGDPATPAVALDHFLAGERHRTEHARRTGQVPEAERS